MKRTFNQIAQDLITNHESLSLDCRAILGWFGNASLYFPTEEEIIKAQKALIWLYENVSHNGSVHLDPAVRNKCIASFAREFLLPNNVANQLFTDFICKSDTSRPIIIGIEGLDGSGKTVQAKKLSSVFEKQGKKVCLIDFPQYSSFFGKEIGSLLSGTHTASAMDLDEKSMCLWYALDRWEAIRKVEIEKYDYVIFNRYTLSSVVYQSARKFNAFNREFADWVFGLEHTHLMLPIPDIYIYLDTKTELCSQNVLKKGERSYVDGLDVYERSRDLLACCHDIYKQLSEQILEIKFLKCTDDSGKLKGIEQIHTDIIACLSAYGLSI